eukprot:c21414_g1_i1 orf=118-1095(+)
MPKSTQEQGMVRRVEGERWNCGHLVRFCKKYKGAIIICGAILLVGAGLAARKKLLYSEPSPTSSFLSEDEEKTVIETLVAIEGTKNVGASTSDTSKQVKNALITDKDRLELDMCLQSEEGGGWHEVLYKNEPTMEYSLLSRKTKGGATQYLSTTRYKYIEDTTQVKNFMIDNDYKKESDKTYVTIESLDLEPNTGIEYLHVIKKYDVIGYREYVLASKLWEKEIDKSFYSVTKACTHKKAPKAEHTLVTNYLSGWKISKAKKGGCEVKLLHQEDLKSTSVTLFKDMFKSQLFAYVVENEKRLQDYMKKKRKPKEERSATSLAQKI